MSWLDYHRSSEEFASKADVARFQRDFARARQFYRQAAEQEELALTQLDEQEPRTFGITAVSAAALWHKAGEPEQARQVASTQLTNSCLPSFAAAQLRELLNEIKQTETLLNDVEQWCASVPVSLVDRERLQKSVTDWKASVAA